MEVAFENIRQAEGITEVILPLKNKLEQKFNLSQQVGNEKNIILTWNKVMRICLIASLSLPETRSIDELDKIQLSRNSQRIMPSFFTKDNNRTLFSALLKLRYKDCEVDWQDPTIVGRIIAQEIYRGIRFLSEDENLNSFLYSVSDRRRSSNSREH